MKASTPASAPTTIRPRWLKTARAWRRAVGVTPERFLTAYQIHSPDVVVAETPWTSDTRPRADAIVTRVPGLAIGVSTADCGPVLFADPAGADHRRRPFRLARRGRRRAGSDHRRDGAARRRARPDRRRHRPDDQPAELRGGQRPAGAIHQGGRGQCPILRPRPARPRAIRPAGLYRRPPWPRRNCPGRGFGRLHLCRSAAVLQFPPHHPPGRAGLWPPRQRHRAF